MKERVGDEKLIIITNRPKCNHRDNNAVKMQHHNDIAETRQHAVITRQWKQWRRSFGDADAVHEY